jgi:hypothetical protein
VLSRLFLALAILIASPFLLVYGFVWVSYTLTAWLVWGTRGRDVLIVTSDSPVWSKYFDEEIIRPLATRAIVLNWSERSRWTPSFTTWAFHFFGGHREFCPMVVVLRPFRIPRTLRFFKPFKAWKHGEPAEVDGLTSELFGLLD